LPEEGDAEVTGGKPKKILPSLSWGERNQCGLGNRRKKKTPTRHDKRIEGGKRTCPEKWRGKREDAFAGPIIRRKKREGSSKPLPRKKIAQLAIKKGRAYGTGGNQIEFSGGKYEKRGQVSICTPARGKKGKPTGLGLPIKRKGKPGIHRRRKWKGGRGK